MRSEADERNDCCRLPFCGLWSLSLARSRRQSWRLWMCMMGGGGMSGVETGSVHTGMGIMQTVSHRGPLDQLSRWPDSCKTRGGGGVFLTATSGATPVTGLHHNLRAAAFWHGLGPLPPPTPNHIRAASHDVGGGGQALPFWTTGTDGKRACGPDPPTWPGGGGFPT